jgi:hypothetical protein
MPYLNVDLDYFDHRKTKRLIGLLGRGAEILPLRLWAYCGKFHCEDGRFTGYSEQEIESIASWWGQGGLMLPAMVTADWMACDAVGWLMCAWEEHQGHLAAFKAKAKAMAKTRWDKAREEAKRLDAASIAVSITEKPPKQCPIRSVPTDPTVPTEQTEPVARGKGFPVTIDDAVKQCALVPVPKEFVMQCFSKADSRGGKDAKGIEIARFSSYVLIEWKYELDRKGREKASGKGERDYSKF